MIPSLVRLFVERKAPFRGNRQLIGKRECHTLPAEYDYIHFQGETYRVYRLTHNWDDNTVDLLVTLTND